MLIGYAASSLSEATRVHKTLNVKYFPCIDGWREYSWLSAGRGCRGRLRSGNYTSVLLQKCRLCKLLSGRRCMRAETISVAWSDTRSFFVYNFRSDRTHTAHRRLLSIHVHGVVGNHGFPQHFVDVTVRSISIVPPKSVHLLRLAVIPVAWRGRGASIGMVVETYFTLCSLVLWASFLVAGYCLPGEDLYGVFHLAPAPCGVACRELRWWWSPWNTPRTGGSPVCLPPTVARPTFSRRPSGIRLIKPIEEIGGGATAVEAACRLNSDWSGRTKGSMRVIEVNMEWHRNERTGETGDPRGNPPTNDIVRHDSHMRKSGDPPGPQCVNLAHNFMVTCRAKPPHVYDMQLTAILFRSCVSPASGQLPFKCFAARLAARRSRPRKARSFAAGGINKTGGKSWHVDVCVLSLRNCFLATLLLSLQPSSNFPSDSDTQRPMASSETPYREGWEMGDMFVGDPLERFLWYGHEPASHELQNIDTRSRRLPFFTAGHAACSSIARNSATHSFISSNSTLGPEACRGIYIAQATTWKVQRTPSHAERTRPVIQNNLEISAEHYTTRGRGALTAYCISEKESTRTRGFVANLRGRAADWRRLATTPNVQLTAAVTSPLTSTQLGPHGRELFNGGGDNDEVIAARLDDTTTTLQKGTLGVPWATLPAKEKLALASRCEARRCRDEERVCSNALECRRMAENNRNSGDVVESSFTGVEPRNSSPAHHGQHISGWRSANSSSASRNSGDGCRTRTSPESIASSPTLAEMALRTPDAASSLARSRIQEVLLHLVVLPSWFIIQLSGTIPACESPDAARPRIEPGSPRWETSRLIAHPPRPRPIRSPTLHYSFQHQLKHLPVHRPGYRTLLLTLFWTRLLRDIHIGTSIARGGGDAALSRTMFPDSQAVALLRGSTCAALPACQFLQLPLRPSSRVLLTEELIISHPNEILSVPLHTTNLNSSQEAALCTGPTSLPQTASLGYPESNPNLKKTKWSLWMFCPRSSMGGGGEGGQGDLLVVGGSRVRAPVPPTRRFFSSLVALGIRQQLGLTRASSTLLDDQASKSESLPRSKFLSDHIDAGITLLGQAWHDTCAQVVWWCTFTHTKSESLGGSNLGPAIVIAVSCGVKANDGIRSPFLFPGRGDSAARMLSSNPEEPGSIPSSVSPGYPHVRIVPDDVAGRRVFSGGSLVSPSLHSGTDPS
ncbi:hypothetical protein PR048_003630 [Dryococelus australis]|uniref:Uncharacterized protein n=1 Tax=Dryococelus australis TaxID=614101 RepID=A0ABQ9IPY1_9NEOP|nr:hypothetical protein PR048_003630 [Dryococelus australis]